MTFPTPQQIKRIAKECGYVERREEASHTLFFKKSAYEGRDEYKYPTLINVFHTTRGAMTKLSHPKSGYNQLWRSMAYDSEETLKAILDNPRTHTGKGHRTADKAKRGCILCGVLKDRKEFSKNQWRKNVGDSKCIECVQDTKSLRKNEDISCRLSAVPPAASSKLPILFLGTDQWFVDACGDTVKNHSVVLTSGTLIRDPSQAKIPNVSHKYCGVITTDDWFDVDDEYQPLANGIFRILTEMYHAGGSVVVAATMGIFTVPRQISTIFGFDSPWVFRAYTAKNIMTTPTGREILGDAFPNHHVYAKSHFIQAPLEECLFQEYINVKDYEDDSDYDEIPSPNRDSPIVTHCGPNGGRISYFGFVNDLDVSYGDIMMKLTWPSENTIQQAPKKKRLK
mmetsp:Transcript_23463/g.47605  ORF Transcript_23463/g.47605 Transcript_23463/m.47605 type:complete len:396 (-) Transcript_23463:498-1685(-)